MSANWSINPDTRNPDRIREFLSVLSEFEGSHFNPPTQKLFFRRIVQKKLYVPVPVKNNPSYQPYYDNAEELPEAVLSEIMGFIGNQDLRGRGKASPLTHFGFSVAREALGKVVITESGKAFLNGSADLKDLFLRIFLKWQFPNPLSKAFNASEGYNIIPFVTALHFISDVNRKCGERGEKAKGISREEFGLFLLTLKDRREMERHVDMLFEYRALVDGAGALDKEELKTGYCRLRLSEVYNINKENANELDKKLSNLMDYTDTVIRYFRLTDYIVLRGNGYYVDVSRTKSVELQRILENFHGDALHFTNLSQYVNYLSDINQPRLPWENRRDLTAICNKLLDDIGGIVASSNKAYDTAFDLPEGMDFENVPLEALRDYVGRLKELKLNVLETVQRLESRELNRLEDYIGTLKKIDTRSIYNLPLYLEWYTALSLVSLNDAINIKPNYPVGDDNTPISTAPSGCPDIECRYRDFYLVCEVTMLSNRTQWVSEGQPVQRHVRDFEERNSDKNTYCLFIAPSIHQDTLNTFFMANKYEYQGRPLKIVPLTIRQYIRVLEFVLCLRKSGKNMKQLDFKALLDGCLKDLDGLSSTDWLSSIPGRIASWYDIFAPGG